MQHLVTSEFEFFTEKTGWGEKVENRDVMSTHPNVLYISFCFMKNLVYAPAGLKYINILFSY